MVCGGIEAWFNEKGINKMTKRVSNPLPPGIVRPPPPPSPPLIEWQMVAKDNMKSISKELHSMSRAERLVFWNSGFKYRKK